MEGGHGLLERMLNDKNVEPTNIPMSLLKSITNNFSDDQKIGCGGFAVVYKVPLVVLNFKSPGLSCS
jgi:coatomer subunit beta'